MELGRKCPLVLSCRNFKNGCRVKSTMENAAWHEEICFYRTVKCAGDFFRGGCGWSGPIGKMVPHVLERKCALVLENLQDNCPFVSSIGDFPGEGMSVFERKVPTNWKTVLLWSQQIMRLWAFVVVYRTSGGWWVIYVRSYASEEARKRLQVKIVVRRPRPPPSCPPLAPPNPTAFTSWKAALLTRFTSEEEGKAEQARKVDSVSFHGRLFGPKETPREVLASGEYLCLTDSQVQRFRAGRILFEYSIEITMKE